ncbi:hypothetical protein TNCV_810981 [Trichonephila clavipes]|uniref:Uncharacterized protein n=1 Tax=Trichonephila clavipes TaxID=2585209 RepID=A0A8X6SC64_TRICX|nr:hypothetical protein TNCV_810981 [Trichonephila clavipes]
MEKDETEINYLQLPYKNDGDNHTNLDGRLREGLMKEDLPEDCMTPGYSKDIANQLFCASGTNQTACQVLVVFIT